MRLGRVGRLLVLTAAMLVGASPRTEAQLLGFWEGTAAPPQLPVAVDAWRIPMVPQEPPRSLVRPGDSLSAIARRECGRASAWREIFEANRDRIRNPNLIYAGQELRVPCAARDGLRASAPAPAAMDPGLTHLPLSGRGLRVSSPYGHREGLVGGNGLPASRHHRGIDLAAPEGTTVVAAAGGVVTAATWSVSGGYMVAVAHASGYTTRYLHLKEWPAVRPGERVAGGQPLGSVGQTGTATGPNLHFDVTDPGGRRLDPEPWLRALEARSG